MIVFLDFLNESHYNCAEELVCDMKKLKAQLAEDYKEIYIEVETGDIVAAKTFEGKLIHSNRINDYIVKNVRHAYKLLKCSTPVDEPSIRGYLLGKKLDIV